jgi:hypothetical protein
MSCRAALTDLDLIRTDGSPLYADPFYNPEASAKGRSIVYQALPPHPQTHSPIEVVERCCALGYRQLMKRFPQHKAKCGSQFYGTSTE